MNNRVYVLVYGNVRSDGSEVAIVKSPFYQEFHIAVEEAARLNAKELKRDYPHLGDEDCKEIADYIKQTSETTLVELQESPVYHRYIVCYVNVT